MMNYFYKSFLIAIISGSLTTMNVTAYAGENQSAIAQMTTAPSSNLSRDANGVVQSNESHSFSGTDSGDSPLHIITMLAVGVIGTKLMMYKKWTTDMTVVAAASVAYIAAEILNIMNLKSQMKDLSMDVTKRADGKMDQAQIATLEKLKESYEKVKKAAKTKMMLQKAAGAAYLLAAGIAGWQRLTEDGQLASCQAGIASAETALATCVTEQTAAASAACSTGVGCAAAVAFTNNATQCSFCAASLGALSTLMISTKAKSEMPSPSLAQAMMINPLDLQSKTAITTPCTGLIDAPIKASMVAPACTSYLVNKEINKGYGENFVEVGFNKIGIPLLDKVLFANNLTLKNSSFMSVDPTLKQRNMLQKMLDIFIPNAEAGIGAMLGLGTGAAVAFYSARLGISKTIDTYMFTPGGRMIAWGILAGAAFLGASATDKEIKKIEGNISEIDKILKDMNTLKKGIKSNNVQEQQIRLASFQAAQSEDMPLTVNPNEKLNCLNSKGDSKCASLADTLRGMPDFANLPESFKSIASQSAQLGDGVSGSSISSGTMSLAEMLANKKGAIAKLNDSIKNKINDKLAKSGKAKIDFDKQEKTLWNKLKGQTEKALRSKGMSGSSFLASAGMSSAPSSALASTPGSLLKKTASQAPVAAPPAGNSKDKDFSLDFQEAPVADGAGFGSGAGTKDDKFDIGSNDINTNSGESIFQVISNRYIKSGYPKLLDEIPVKN